MSGWLIAGIGLVYLGVSLKEAMANNWPMAVIFFGYAFSNVGFVWALR